MPKYSAVKIELGNDANGYVQAATATGSNMNLLGLNEVSEGKTKGFVVTSGTLATTDDIRINDVQVGATTLDSAKAKAAAINAISEQTGVTAEASTTLDLEIDFANDVIKRQKTSYNETDISFKMDLCRARTFGFKEEVEMMRKAGLARGGSLENAIVLSGDKVLNKGGLRYNNEFVRHKILDCIGDFYLAGAKIKGAFSCFKSGHYFNNYILKNIFADRANYSGIH